MSWCYLVRLKQAGRGERQELRGKIYTHMAQISIHSSPIEIQPNPSLWYHVRRGVGNDGLHGPLNGVGHGAVEQVRVRVEGRIVGVVPATVRVRCVVNM